MLPDVSDEQLVERAKAGDRDAFFVLYNRYLKLVYNRVKSRVPYQEAEDVTQDIFIAVVRSLDNFEQRSKFSTWLYTIVNRQIADFYRKRYRRGDEQQVGLSDDDEELLAGDESLLRDDILAVQQALAELPDNYQEVILMRFADGLPFADIALQRGQSIEATKSLFRRALKAIVERMGN